MKRYSDILRPCPFCGNTAELYIVPRLNMLSIYVKCVKCGIKKNGDFIGSVFTADAVFNNIATVAEKWNKRIDN